MTITALPINASGGSPAYTAKQTRQAFSALMMPGAAQLRTRSGFRPGGAPSVSVTSTTWTVGAFSCVIDAGVTAVQAPYLVASDANSTGSVTAADATFARKDLLYVQVNDTDEDGSGLRSATVGYLAGTASASPSAPATPARSVSIGVIDVPHVGAGSPAFTTAYPTFVAAGGTVPVFSQAERDALSASGGMMVARMEVAPPRLEVYDGSTWQQANQASAASSYTTNGTMATSSGTTEVAMAAWTGGVNTTFTFANGYLYKLEIGGGTANTNTTNGNFASSVIRVRKGVNTTSGQQLLQVATMAPTHSQVMSFQGSGYVKNASGADISTALGVTVMRGGAGINTDNALVYGDANLPLVVTVTRLGLTANMGTGLSGIAVSIT